MCVNPNLIYQDGICVLLYSSIVGVSAYANVFFTIICECIRQINIQMSRVHCGSVVEFSWALLDYPITAHHLYASLL